MSSEIVTRLDVFLEGTAAPIGTLTGDADQALAFRYTTAGIAAGRQLSLAMPLDQADFGDAAARAFFGNLLQENATLDRVLAEHRLDRGDIAGILYHLGRDCAGAVSVVPEGGAPDKAPGVLATDYVSLGPGELAGIVEALARQRRLPDAARDPSPLAGVQGKIALARLPDGRLALPRPGTGAPTTHILKVPRQGEEALVDQEHALMRLAAGVLDHPVAQTEILEFDRGAGNQGDALRGLLVTRYDRRVQDGTVFRLHQEDFAQALGIPAARKYGRTPDDPFSAAAIGTLLAATATPARSRAVFRDITLFNLAAGNTDNHAKNHALLYPDAGPPVLAPLYDAVPILLDAGVNHEFGFRIGDATSSDSLNRGEYDAFLEAIGFHGTTARRNARRQTAAAEALLARIVGGIDGLSGPRLKLLGDMLVDQAGRVAAALGIPIETPDRDAFLLRGGGFRLGS